jgi:GxxExxY protein
MTTTDTQLEEEYYEDFLDQHLRNASTQSSLREDINKMVADIHMALGAGHSERVYHNAFEVSLRELNIPYESERHVPIYYKHHVVGTARADIIVRRTTVLELKTVKSLNDIMIAQAKKYLTQLNLTSAYLINFPPGEGSKPQIAEVTLSE